MIWFSLLLSGYHFTWQVICMNFGNGLWVSLYSLDLPEDSLVSKCRTNLWIKTILWPLVKYILTLSIPRLMYWTFFYGIVPWGSWDRSSNIASCATKINAQVTALMVWLMVGYLRVHERSWLRRGSKPVRMCVCLQFCFSPSSSNCVERYSR